jgi:hypothetical protein
VINDVNSNGIFDGKDTIISDTSAGKNVPLMSITELNTAIKQATLFSGMRTTPDSAQKMQKEMQKEMQKNTPE